MRGPATTTRSNSTQVGKGPATTTNDTSWERTCYYTRSNDTQVGRGPATILGAMTHKLGEDLLLY